MAELKQILTQAGFEDFKPHTAGAVIIFKVRKGKRSRANPVS
jgi:hypothetical protein